MPPAGPSAQAIAVDVLKQLRETQTAMLDKASTYTKIVIGIGDGGFFTAWAGTRQHLRPSLVVISALLIIVSLVLYIVFEVVQAMFVSHMAIQLSRAVSVPTANLPQALESYSERMNRITRPLHKSWYVIFPLSALTGLGAAPQRGVRRRSTH